MRPGLLSAALQSAVAVGEKGFGVNKDASIGTPIAFDALNKLYSTADKGMKQIHDKADNKHHKEGENETIYKKMITDMVLQGIGLAGIFPMPIKRVATQQLLYNSKK